MTYIPAAISQFFIPAKEHVTAAETRTNEGNTELEKEPVTAGAKISKC